MTNPRLFARHSGKGGNSWRDSFSQALSGTRQETSPVPWKWLAVLWYQNVKTKQEWSVPTFTNGSQLTCFKIIVCDEKSHSIEASLHGSWWAMCIRGRSSHDKLNYSSTLWHKFPSSAPPPTHHQRMVGGRWWGGEWKGRVVCITFHVCIGGSSSHWHQSLTRLSTALHVSWKYLPSS